MSEQRRRRISPVAIAAALLLLVGAGGAVADEFAPAPPRKPAPLPAPTSGGVWACPVVTAGAQSGYLALANASVEPSVVRIRIVRPPQPSTESRLTLAPGRATAVKISGGSPAGAIVQWAGGDVVVSRSALVFAANRKAVAAGATCSRTGETTLVVPGLRTLQRDARVVLLNPSRADAVVDVSFLVAGEEQTPETLTRRVVPGRGRLEVRVGDFVFDRSNVGAVVRVRTGTVVADGVLFGPQGVAIIPATAPLRDAVASASPSFGGHVSVASIGEDPATLVSTTITSKGQQTTANFPPALDPFTSTGFVFRDGGPVSFALSARDNSSFVAVLGWSTLAGGAGDLAVVPFVPPARRWLAVTQAPIASWSAHIVLSNPGTETVRARARLLTPRGQVASGDLASITLLPGRALAFPLDARSAVAGVEVIAIDGEIGFSLVTGGGPRTARFLYAMAGAPPGPLGAPVILDRRAGIPAPLED